jgi:hypothetical protein
MPKTPNGMRFRLSQVNSDFLYQASVKLAVVFFKLHFGNLIIVRSQPNFDLARVGSLLREFV